MSGYSFDEMDHTACGEELKHRVVGVGEWYRLEILSSVFGVRVLGDQTRLGIRLLHNCHVPTIGFV